MRILVPDAQSFHGGLETVTTRIIHAWTTNNQVEVTWLLPPHRYQQFSNKFEGNHRLKIDNFQWPKIHPRPLLLSFFKRVNQTLARFWEFKCNEAKLRKIAREQACDYCFYFWPIKESFPTLPIPVFCLICDLAWQRIRESYPDENPKDLDNSIRNWVSRCQRVFTISSSTRKEVLELAPKMAAKIHDVLLAADSFNTKAPISNSGQSITHDDTPYFLYPSAPNPHKNHLVLFKAVLCLVERGLHFRLVLTGGQTGQLLGSVPMERHAPEQARRFFQQHKHELSETIVATDNIPETTLSALYHECLAVLMPSQYEGFGLAVAEAFAHGKPVIASDLPVFREQIDCYQADGFVDTFQATDHQALSNLMEARLRKGPLSDEHSRELGEKTARWTWNDVATGYLRLMQEPSVPWATA